MSAATGTGELVSVNVGRPELRAAGQRLVRTAIFKAPVTGRVRIAGESVAGDGQADRRYHGGPDKAVYAYACEDIRWWQSELGRPLGPAAFGENLTLRGVDVTGALIGERWGIGSTVLEVSQPRTPCYKLGVRHGDPGLVRRFARATRPGAYLRIVQPGEVGAGDAVAVVHRPAHEVSVGLVAAAQLDRSLAPLLLAAPELPEGWRQWARERATAGR
jgi:MOSC domain-containing protein YiiM